MTHGPILVLDIPKKNMDIVKDGVIHFFSEQFQLIQNKVFKCYRKYSLIASFLKYCFFLSLWLKETVNGHNVELYVRHAYISSCHMSSIKSK